MKKIRISPHQKRYLKIMAGNLLITGAYAWITVPNRIVNGGVTSFSMILEAITSVNLTILVNFLTIFLMMMCYFFLGRVYFKGTLFSGVCYLLFFSCFRSTGLALYLPPCFGVPLAGIVVGIGYYFCLSAESTAVGFDIIALILNKKNPNLNIALCMYLINLCVLLSGLFTYGLLSILMGIAFTALQSLTLHFLLKNKV